MILFVYCAATLVPAVLVLALSLRRTVRARRTQRHIVRARRYGRWWPHDLFFGIGAVLVVDALIHYARCSEVNPLRRELKR